MSFVKYLRKITGKFDGRTVHLDTIKVFTPTDDQVCLKNQHAIPLQAWSSPEGYRNLRFPDFMTAALESGKVVSLTHRPLLSQGNSHVTRFY